MFKLSIFSWVVTGEHHILFKLILNKDHDVINKNNVAFFTRLFQSCLTQLVNLSINWLKKKKKKCCQEIRVDETHTQNEYS